MVGTNVSMRVVGPADPVMTEVMVTLSSGFEDEVGPAVEDTDDVPIEDVVVAPYARGAARESNSRELNDSSMVTDAVKECNCRCPYV